MENLNKLQELASEFSVLYVEDDELLMNQTSLFLKKFFKSVDLAKNGKDGLSLYKQNFYEIIISDIKMPIMNGMDMIEKIHEINPNQLILVISAFDFSDLIEPTHLTHKVDEFLLKPVPMEVLVNSLLNLCKKYKTEHKNNLNLRLMRDVEYLKKKVEEMDKKLDLIVTLIK